jgi:signal transduction histidine kinase
VRSLLRFARPDRGQARLASVAEVIAEAAAAAGVPNGRLQLRGELDVSVDADALVRVLANLFQNAVEAAPEAMLQVDAATGNGRLELLVQDDGPGVAHDLGQRAFEPFVSTKERGTGLGLPLSARVLSFLGGDLELCNPGQPGARFRVRLPLRQVERTEAAAEVAS